MVKKRSNLCLDKLSSLSRVALAVLFLTPSALAQQWAEVKGFEAKDEAESHEPQQQSMWCWAASIQAILNHYGIERSQRDIVLAVWKRLDNLPATSPNQYVDYLNTMRFNDGDELEVTNASYAQQWITPADLYRELTNDHPILVWVRSGPLSAHVIVVYGALFTRNGEVLEIKYFDPWPGVGEQVVDIATFSKSSMTYNIIRAARIKAKSRPSTKTLMRTDQRTVSDKITSNKNPGTKQVLKQSLQKDTDDSAAEIEEDERARERMGEYDASTNSPPQNNALGSVSSQEDKTQSKGPSLKETVDWLQGALNEHATDGVLKVKDDLYDDAFFEKTLSDYSSYRIENCTLSWIVTGDETRKKKESVDFQLLKYFDTDYRVLLKDLDPINVKVVQKQDELQNERQYWVIELTCSANKKCFSTHVETFRFDGIDPKLVNSKETTGEQKAIAKKTARDFSSLSHALPISNREIAKRVANALKHAIKLCGGKADPF